MSIIARIEKELKELFHYIKPGQEQGSSRVLVIKLGERLRSVVVTDTSWSDLYYISYNLADSPAEYSLPELENKCPWINETYTDVKIILDYPHNLLVPIKGYDKEHAADLLDAMHGYCGDEMIVEEDVPGWQLKNIYALPKAAYDWFHRKFPGAIYKHSNTLAIPDLAAAGNEGIVLADLSTAAFTVLAGRDNRFLFAGTFEYETPEDVLYYLLQTCEQFSLSTEKVSLQLSGLIEKDSALYKELYQYFIHIGLRDANWSNAAGYPAHFFTSFNDMSKCGS